MSRRKSMSGSGARLARRVLEDRLGLEIRRADRTRGTQQPERPRRGSLPKSATLFDLDTAFHELYRQSVERLGGSDPRSEHRLYNLAQAALWSDPASGLVAEVGCFKGLSTGVLCTYLRMVDPAFDGSGLHVFDSFEGISALQGPDEPDSPTIPTAGVARAAGLFKADMDSVRRHLADFPRVTLHKGWVPEVLAEAPPGPYRLVHVDVDVWEPTRDSIEHFFPPLAPGGILVCDDYGSVRWPGARRAVDDFARSRRAATLRLSSGQAILLASGS